MRISLRRLLLSIITILIIILIWYFLWREPKKFTRTCNHTEQYQKQLHALTFLTHDVLQQLELTHFLCYGALWGQIRVARTLPWSDNAEICLLNEELSKNDEVFISRLFWKQGLELSYDLTEGEYTVTSPQYLPKVLLIVFEFDKLTNMNRRIGLKRRLLPPDCESMTLLDCFPPRLIAAPLPLKRFGSVSLPVPREDIEIQKYHYRNNWWKEDVPLNC